MDKQLSKSIRPGLIAEITSAFEEVQLGRGASLHQARAIDDYEDDHAARSNDLEQHWQDVSEAKLQKLNDVLPYLDPIGYRFYIPAFMIWVLTHLDDETQEHSGLIGPTVYSLSPGKASDSWHLTQLERFSFLSMQQNHAICRFLQSLIPYKVHTAEESLLSYWDRFCTTGGDVC